MTKVEFNFGLFFDLFSAEFRIFLLKMFSKAPIKRFNESTSETPAPSDYDPQEVKSKGSKVALLKSERFLDLPKLATPGPGSYETSSLPSSSKGKGRLTVPRHVDHVQIARMDPRHQTFNFYRIFHVQKFEIFYLT